MFQFTDAEKRGLVFAFRLTGAPEAQRVRLRGLEPMREYTVTWTDAGREERLTGAHLMEQGIDFDSLPEEGSEIVTVF